MAVSVAGIQMPKYKCHKVVYALKIEKVVTIRDEQTLAYSHMIYPEDIRYAPIDLDDAFVYKHNVTAPGYYIVYEDGYKSWSPVEAFESGYARID